MSVAAFSPYPSMTLIRKHKSYKSTTLLPLQPKVIIHVTHPFSPLKGRPFELVERKYCWGEDRVLCFDENGFYRRLLTSWTDYSPQSAFEEISNGRAVLSDKTMIELARIIEQLASELST